MLKIKRIEDQMEVPILESPGKAAVRLLDHFTVKMFRIDTTPVPIVEITLARADKDGNEEGPLTQFCLKDAEAQQFMDDAKFQSFISHLEDIAVASCSTTVKGKCPIEVERGL